MKITVELDSAEDLLSLQPLLNAVRYLKVSSIPAVVDEPTHVPDEYRKIPIQDMEITSRSYHCLLNHGIKDVWQLAMTSRKALKQQENFGAKSLREVENVLWEKHHLKLRP